MKLITALILLAITTTSTANEADFTKAFCLPKGGKVEVVLDDKTRIDCLLFGIAFETEYAHKYKEAPGQAAHYARKTNSFPGILLIMQTAADCPYLDALETDLNYVDSQIKVWQIGPYAGQC